MADSFSPDGAAAPVRKRMVFTKRDPEAAAKLEAERTAGAKSNPFGDAKPREKVIAERTGKDEKDILVEDSQEYRFKLRLNPEQRAEKNVFDDEVKALKDQIAEAGEDEEANADLKAQLAAKQAEVRDLMAKFEEMIVQEAKQGTGMRPSERRAAAAAREAEGGGGGGGDRQAEFGQGYGNSAAPRRGGDRGGYGDGAPKAYQERGDYNNEPRDGGSKGFPGYQARPEGEKRGGFGGDRDGGRGGGDRGGDRGGGGGGGGGAFGGNGDWGESRGGGGGFKGDYKAGGGGGGGGGGGAFDGDYPMGAGGGNDDDYRSPYSK